MDTQWFQNRRKKLKRSQAELGEAIRKDRTVAGRIETGKQPMSVEEIIQFARFLEVSPIEILSKAVDCKIEDLIGEFPAPSRPLNSPIDTSLLADVLAHVTREEKAAKVTLTAVEKSEIAAHLYQEVCEIESEKQTESLESSAGNVLRFALRQRHEKD